LKAGDTNGIAASNLSKVEWKVLNYRAAGLG